MRKALLYEVGILLLVLCACDTKHDLSLNGTTEKHVAFHCGAVNLKAYTVARSIFNVEQDFTLTEQAVIYKDSIRVIYKGKFLEYSLSIEGKEIGGEWVNVGNGEVITMGFGVQDPLPHPGDTVILQDQGYLYCNGSHVDFGEIFLIVND